MKQRYQLMEDVCQTRTRERPLTTEQRAVLDEIKRPQLQQDVYERMISQGKISRTG